MCLQRASRPSTIVRACRDGRRYVERGEYGADGEREKVFVGEGPALSYLQPQPPDQSPALHNGRSIVDGKESNSSNIIKCLQCLADPSNHARATTALVIECEARLATFPATTTSGVDASQATRMCLAYSRMEQRALRSLLDWAEGV